MKFNNKTENGRRDVVSEIVRRLGIYQLDFRRYFVNTSWMIAEQILRIIAGLVVGIWVARYLGPEQFGIFSYALAFTAIFGGMAKLGLDRIVVRDLVKDPQKRDVYMGTTFWLKVIAGFTTLGMILFITVFTISVPLTRLYIFIIASGLIFQSFEVIDFYFQSQVLSKFVSFCKIIQVISSSILKLYLIITGADLIWFVVVSLVDDIALAVTLFIVYRCQNIGNFYRHFDLITAKKLLLDSWPLIFSTLAVMVYMRIDQVMIKEMLGDREVGLYSVAVRLSEGWYFVSVVVTSSLFPAIIDAKKISESLYHARIQRLYTFLAWLAIGIALPMALISDWLVTNLYGMAYKEAGAVLKIYIWAGVFVSLGVASGSWLATENLQLLSLYRTMSGAIVNICLCYILIPIFGIIGAAIATLVSIAVASYVYDIFNRKTRTMFIQKTKALFLFGSF